MLYPGVLLVRDLLGELKGFVGGDLGRDVLGDELDAEGSQPEGKIFHGSGGQRGALSRPKFARSW